MSTRYRTSRLELTYNRSETFEVELDGFTVQLQRDETSASVYVLPSGTELEDPLAALVLFVSAPHDAYDLSWTATTYNQELPDYEARAALAVEGLRLMEKALANSPSGTSRMHTAARKAGEALRRVSGLALPTLASAARDTADAVSDLRRPFLDPSDATWQWGWDKACEAVASHLDRIAVGATDQGPDQIEAALRAVAVDVHSLEPSPSWAWGEQSPAGWRDGLAAAAALLEERAAQFPAARTGAGMHLSATH